MERYLGEYGLLMDPFNHESPDPRMFYLTDSAAGALSNIITNIEARASLSILVADFGVGKTTFARMLWEHWSGKPGYHLALLDSTSFSTPRSLLDAIGRELRIGRSARSLGDYLELTKRWLFDEVVARADRCVVVVDEAQFLRVAQMNMLRNIINFALPGDAAPVQFLLVGTPRLITTLGRSPALYKRKSCLVTMQPFTRRETEVMLLHRLRQAGYKGAGLFTPPAIEVIHQTSRGVPREITKLANWSLRKGHANGATMIDLPEVREAQLALGEDLPLQEPDPDAGSEPLARPGGLTREARPTHGENPENPTGVLLRTPAHAVGTAVLLRTPERVHQGTARRRATRSAQLGVPDGGSPHASEVTHGR